MVDTFASRITSATQKEQDDTARLEALACEVYRFGQALLPDGAREHLRKYPSTLFLRWLPDLLVVRPDLYQTDIDEWMWLVDSKTGRQDTANWLLEKAAHAAHRLQRIALGLSIVYIWPDGCTCSYVEDLSDDVLVNGRWNGSGSGTPFWLVPKKLTRSLDEIFGKSMKRKGGAITTTPSVSRHRGGLPEGGYLKQMEAKR